MLSNRRQKRTFFLLALIALLAHSFALVGLLPGALPSGGDTIGAFMPWHEFARRAFWARGEMPLWNPHLYCGVPFLSNGQSGLLYPPNLLFVLLPENAALWLFAYGHSLFLMLGGYFLGRTLGMKRRAAFLVAALLGLGGATPAHLFGGHLTYLPVRSFWPWEAAFLLRLLRGQGRVNAIWLAGCVALGLAAGAPQLWLFGLLICFGVFLLWSAEIVLLHGGRTAGQWKRVRIPLLFSAVMAALWCAPLLLPLRELRAWSSHGDSLTYEQVTDLSATGRSLFRLLFNDFFGGNSIYMWSLRGNAGEDAASIGLAAAILALLAPFCGRKSRAIPALCVFCGCMIVLALGSSTPLYRLLYDHVALVQSTRVPARWLELWAFGATLLAGYSLDGMLRQPERLGVVRKVFGGVALACLPLLVFTWLARAPWVVGAQIIIRAMSFSPARVEGIAQGLHLEALLSCFLSAASVAGIVWFLRGGLNRRNTVPIFLGLLLFLPLASFWRSVRLGIPQNVSRAMLPSFLMEKYQAGERWIVRAPFGRLNAPLTAGIDAFNGYEPFGSAPFFEFAEAAQPSAQFSADFQPLRMLPMWRVAGVSHLLWQPIFIGEVPQDFAGTDLTSENIWTLRTLDDGLKAWPRAYLSQNGILAPPENRYDVLKKLAQAPFQEPYPVVIEPDFPPLSKGARGGLTVKPHSATPDVLEWDIEVPGDAIFVYQAALAPGWTAFVDGHRVGVHRVNGFFQGVPVRGNAKRVALVYDTETLRVSFFMALCGLGLAASLWVASTAKKAMK